MKLFRRSLLALSLAVSLPTAALFMPTDASASVSIAVGFDAIVKDADAVAIVSATESSSVWEEGRIFTYTKVKVDENVAGDLPAGSEVWIRTMGGVVGKIGQMVDGEPTFTVGKPSLLFLRRFKTSGTWEVSARAQGQYPVVPDEITKAKKVVRSSSAGLVLPPKTAAVAPPRVAPESKVRLAQDVMHDRPVADVTREIATTFKKLHSSAAKSE